MAIDIRGVSPVNKGAQLMLTAISDRLGSTRVLSSNPWQGTYDRRSRLGLRQTIHHYRFRRASVFAGNALPAKAADKFGLVRDRDITGVLDASGFAYSDSFSLDRHQREAFFGRRWAKAGVPKIMLPQAFGPFRDKEKARLAAEILDQAEVVFARDDVSLANLNELGIETEVIRSVDFTIGLHPPEMDPVKGTPFVAIVPNTKIVSSGRSKASDYTALLEQYAVAAERAGREALLVVHEDTDRSIAEEIASRRGLDIFEDEDPLILKAVLGQADAIVASRFHAVVGALAQGVPSVVLGWSHKYAQLLNDFGVPQWSADLQDDPSETLAAVMNDAAGVATARARRSDLIRQVDQMWSRTEQALR
jgi:colanic acid/amylovoran biosynthesis protein